MIGIECSLNDFQAALSSLNEKLKVCGLTIEIRAIGGFAMLYNKLRKGGYTMDVDTATKDISDVVMELVHEVADEMGLDDDWINNESYRLSEVVDIVNDIEWLIDKSYSNIDLYVANITSLLLLKVRAIHFAGLVPRITDRTDLLDILSFLGIHTIDEVRANSLTRDIETLYPRCFKFLCETNQW